MNVGYLIILLILSVVGFCAIVIGYGWFYRVRRLVNLYLQNFSEIIGSKPLRKNRFLPFYSKYEIAGVYKGRQIIGGIQYSGLGIEFMPLPYLKLRLKEVIRYNIERLPEFAYIEKGWLVFKHKHRLVWGIFDKEYERLFTREFILITLARLLAVAEDLERGKTIEEIFK